MIGFNERDFIQAIVALVVLGMAVGALLVWLVPLAWAWIRPFLHALTA